MTAESLHVATEATRLAVSMNQLNLFEPERLVREPAPTDPAFARRHLTYALRIVRRAVILPWSPSVTQTWAEDFPKLASALPEEESGPMIEAFRRELSRLSEI